MSNFMIINSRNTQYEYIVDNISAALDRYIEDVLGFERNFTVSKYFWEKIKNSVSTDDDKVRLVNGFCKRRRSRIQRVLAQYTTVYSIPTNGEYSVL